MKSVVLLAVILLFVFVVGAAGIDRTVRQGLNSLNQLIQFMTNDSNIGTIVPDILFGMTLALGQVRVLLRHLQQDSCTVDLISSDRYELISQLSEIEIKMGNIIEKEKKNLAPSKSQRLSLLTEKMLDPKLWEINQPLTMGSLREPRQANISSITGSSIYEIMFGGLPDEDISDSCISEVLGIYSTPCHITEICRNVQFGTNDSTGYPLTHRLLFLQAVRQAGCNTIAKPKELEHYAKYFCNLILDEAHFVEYMGYPWMMADLFTEQVALCGMEGFTEFTKPRWLKKILSWQGPEGCWVSFESQYDMFDIERFNHVRQKREDAMMAYNCSMHFTGVASAAVAVSIRSMIECTAQSLKSGK